MDLAFSWRISSIQNSPNNNWSRLIRKGLHDLLTKKITVNPNPFPVPPKLSPFQSSILQLNVGDRASLTCSVIKGDLPLPVTWRKNGHIINTAQHQQVSIKQVDQYNSILVIENLGHDHSGNYSCHVQNTAAEAEISQTLLVNGKRAKHKLFWRPYLSILGQLKEREKTFPTPRLNIIFFFIIIII